MALFKVTRVGLNGEHLLDPVLLTGGRQDAQGRAFVDPAVSAGAVRVDAQGRHFVKVPLTLSTHAVEAVPALSFRAIPNAPLSFVLATGHALQRSTRSARSAAVTGGAALLRSLSASRSSGVPQGHAAGLVRTPERRALVAQGSGITRLVSGFTVRNFSLDAGHAASSGRISVFTRFSALTAATVISRASTATRRATSLAATVVLASRAGTLARRLGATHAVSSLSVLARVAVVQVQATVSRRSAHVRNKTVSGATAVARPLTEALYWLIGRRGK